MKDFVEVDVSVSPNEKKIASVRSPIALAGSHIRPSVVRVIVFFCLFSLLNT